MGSRAVTASFAAAVFLVGFFDWLFWFVLFDMVVLLSYCGLATGILSSARTRWMSCSAFDRESPSLSSTTSCPGSA
jgi:hypothetical protein